MQLIASSSALTSSLFYTEQVCPKTGWHKYCRLAGGLRGPTEFLRTKKSARLFSVGLRSSVLSQQSSVFSPQSSILSPQGSQPHNYWIVRLTWCLMLKTALFCLKNFSQTKIMLNFKTSHPSLATLYSVADTDVVSHWHKHGRWPTS